MKLKLASIVTLIMLGASIMACASGGKNPNDGMNDKKKALVVFYSRTGENYGVGNVSKGNTHKLAEIIAGECGADIFEVKPVSPYPDGYQECVDLAKKEKNAKARPQIVGDISTDGYDIIFIGYPNWWADMPMVMYTFIEKHAWQGKTVVPFCTHEGSGLSQTERYIADACKGATVLKGLAMRGTTAQNDPKKAREQASAWLAKIGIKQQ